MTRRWVAAALALLTALAPAPAAWASCGAEGCPLDLRGPELLRGVVALDLNYQYVDQNQLWSGTSRATGPIESHGILEQETRSSLMVMGARTQLSRSFGLSASLPYVLDRVHRHAFEHHPGYFIPYRWQYSGVGDLTVFGNWTPYFQLPGRAALTAQAGVKAPTGRRHVDQVLGEEPEPAARPGTGSFDWLGGLQLSVPIATRTFGGEVINVPLSLSAMGRANGVGTQDYKMGNEAMVNLAGGYALWHSVSAITQINFLAHAKDQAGQTDADPHHTGAISVLASPGLQLKLTPMLAIYGYGQFRIYEHTNGPQLVSPFHLVFGSSYALGL